MGRIGVICVIAGLVVVGVLAVGMWMESWRRPVRQKWSQIKVGDPEAHVLTALGAPERRYSATDAPADYYVKGYARKPRPITGKVLIYRDRDLILYVWIDPEGRVEDIFVGTS